MVTEHVSPRSLASEARHIYAGEPDQIIRLLQSLRPYICPFETVIPQVPSNADVLDVGCGAGLFLMLLSRANKLRSGLGIDISEKALAAASGAANRLGIAETVKFRRHSIDEGIPRAHWNVITAIDVIHHVPPSLQEQFVRELCSVVPPGGTLIIKDMVATPKWRSTANRLHDLIMARQWVHHVPPERVVAWCSDSGLSVTHQSQRSTLWYGHWLLAMERAPDEP